MISWDVGCDGWMMGDVDDNT